MPPVPSPRCDLRWAVCVPAHRPSTRTRSAHGGRQKGSDRMRITGRGADLNKMTRITPTGISQFALTAAEETFLTEGQGVDIHALAIATTHSRKRGQAILGVI